MHVQEEHHLQPEYLSNPYLAIIEFASETAAG